MLVNRVDDKSLARPEWKKKKFKGRHFFVRRGGHCCRGDLVGLTNCPPPLFFLREACRSQSLIAVACFLPGRPKDLSVPRYYRLQCVFTFYFMFFAPCIVLKSYINQQNAYILNYYVNYLRCLLHVSSTRDHLQEDGCTYSSGVPTEWGGVQPFPPSRNS